MTVGFSTALLLTVAILLGEPAIMLAPHESLLPSSTIAAFSILDSQRWQTDWKLGGFARYAAQPDIADFFSSVADNASAENPWLSMLGSVELRESLAGQATVAVVESDSNPEIIFILDYGDSEACGESLKILRRELTQRNLKIQETKYDQFVLTAFSEGDSSQASIVCCSWGQQLLASSSMDLLMETLKPKDDRLHRAPAFAATVQRSSGALQQPLFWWYFKPFSIIKHVGTQDDSSLDRFREVAGLEKYDTIEAMGGVGNLKRADRPLVLAGQILAKRPWQRSMRLLDFSESTIHGMPNWLSNATSAGFLNVKLDVFLESFSTLFDTVVGEGEAGVFQAVLEDLKSDPQGPGLDLQQELFSQLKTPAWFATDCSLQNSGTVIGIECRDNDRVKSAVTKMFDGDSRARRVSNIDYLAWNVLPLEDNPAGVQEPFTLAVRDGFLLFAPSVEIIDRFFRPEQMAAALSFRSNETTAMKTTSFGFAADLQSLARRRHAQLESGTLDGWMKILADRLNLSSTLKNADRNGLPAFSSVEKFFDAQLRAFGSANQDGWKVIAVID